MPKSKRQKREEALLYWEGELAKLDEWHVRFINDLRRTSGDSKATASRESTRRSFIENQIRNLRRKLS